MSSWKDEEREERERRTERRRKMNINKMEARRAEEARIQEKRRKRRELTRIREAVRIKEDEEARRADTHYYEFLDEYRKRFGNDNIYYEWLLSNACDENFNEWLEKINGEKTNNFIL